MNRTLPYFLTRDGSMVLGGLGCRWEVDRYSFRAVGGPDECWLVAYGPEPALLCLGDLLRCPLEVQRADGQPTWWGFVDGVWIVRDQVQSGVTLDEMGNRVRAGYLPLLAGFDTRLPRTFTSWLDDADSQAMYGVKEYQAMLSGSYADQAGKLAATLLSERKYPGPVMEVLDTAGAPGQLSADTKSKRAAYAIVRARGWWHTTGWRIYEQPMGLEQLDYSASGLGILGSPACQVWEQVFVTQAGLGNWAANSLYLRLHKYGAPADGVYCEIKEGVNVLATSGTISGGSLPDGNGWTEFTFGSPATIQAGHTYEIIAYRTGAMDAFNYYYLSITHQVKRYAAYYRDGGGGWVNTVPPTSLIFKLVGREDTGAQLGRMLAAGCGGQFFAGGVDSPASLGVSELLYRLGESTAREEIERLLLTGNSTGTRYLASVDNTRRATIYPKPGAGADWGIKADGRLLDPLGVPAPAGVVPVGVWLRCADLAPVVVNGQQIADPSRVFIERAEWDKRRQRVKINQE